MTKQILTGEKARIALKQGITQIANAVKITLGPKGRNVVLDRKYTTPLLTNDGVSIAKEIELDDPFQNMGASLIKEVSIKTNDNAGDGTTTACILAEAIINNGLKNIENGANPIILRHGIEKAIKVAVTHLKSISKPVSSDLEIKQIATISAENEEIGTLILNAFKKVGKDGVITIEESKTAQTNLKVTQGLEFDRGYISPYMTSPNSNIATLENPFILITDKKLSNINELLPILEEITKTSRPLLIISEDIDGEVLSTLTLNTIRGTFFSVAVKCPSFGEKQKEFLEDIALLTGGTFIDKDINNDLKSITIKDLGQANSIKVSKDKTIIIGGKSNIEKINKLKTQLKSELTTNLENYDIVKIEDRIARLSDGVAVIEVGAASEIEMKEKKLRVEDALSATKSATKEGIVQGGGNALLCCKKPIKELIDSLVDDEKIGAMIVEKALEIPLRQIARNAGLDDGVILNNVNPEKNIGFDALSNKFINLFEAGIIDPTKVTRSALENAGSVASSILTTEVLITDSIDSNK